MTCSKDAAVHSAGQMGRCGPGGVGGPWAAAAIAGPYPVPMSMTPTCGVRIAPDRPHSRVTTHRHIDQRGNASRTTFDTHPHAKPGAARAALLGEPIAAFGIDDPDEPYKMEGQ